MFGLSGTMTFGRSGTRCPDYREPGTCATRRKCSAREALNNANKESSRFLLTQPRLCKSAARASLPPPEPVDAGSGDPPLTHVTLVWRGGVQEDWLRFGKPVAGRILDRRTRIESYAPGQVFALVRWVSNDYGTVRSALTVARAVGISEPLTTIPQVDPGAQILLSVRSWPKVRQVFALIDAIEKDGIDPCDVAPDHWRHAHNRLAAGMQARSYSPARHRDWLRRRKLQS
mgnify:FL=1